MLLHKIIIIKILIIFSLFSLGQVKIDNIIDFSNLDSSKNQIYGISSPNQLNDANTPKFAISQSFYENYLYNSSTYYLKKGNLNLTNYEVGMEIQFIVDSVNLDSISYVQLDGLGKIPIVKNINTFLPAKQLKKGQVVNLIFDGTNMRMINFINHCPENYLEINNHYCIEKNEHTDTTFWAALDDCMIDNANICSFSEWFNACKLNHPDLLNMTNNYEWINNGADHSQETAIIGNGACEMTTSQNTAPQYLSNERNYRCCYYK